MRNGDPLARPRAPPSGRDPLRRCDLHELTQDHLDFHGTMEEYFHAKRSLFADGRLGTP